MYELYELHLAEQGVHDFDDLVLVAVRALREDAEIRRRWQSRFRHVLVDEYQDIEPGSGSPTRCGPATAQRCARGRRRAPARPGWDVRRVRA
ncbi:MAG: UvrD-helicase domain-containing protein [Actinomycetota bacterium]|nr:UvrD-helicase domain-containing protein [Actinomycetota bacterium]